METSDDTITITSAPDYSHSYYTVAPSSITIDIDEPEIVIGDMTATELCKTIKNQRLEIEALTDILNEIVDSGNLNIPMNIKERVSQKQFLEILSGDSNNEDI
jgi:hypothetical protein